MFSQWLDIFLRFEMNIDVNGPQFGFLKDDGDTVNLSVLLLVVQSGVIREVKPE